MEMSTQLKPGVDGGHPLVAVSAGVTLIGIGTVIARASGMDGPLLALNRSWLGAAVYLAVLLASGRRVGVEQLRLAGPGGAAFGAQIALFYSAIQMTTVANATMIMALHPLVVLIIYAARFGEPTGRMDWLLSSITMAGIGLLVFGSSVLVLLPVTLMLNRTVDPGWPPPRSPGSKGQIRPSRTGRHRSSP